MPRLVTIMCQPKRTPVRRLFHSAFAVLDNRERAFNHVIDHITLVRHPKSAVVLSHRIIPFKQAIRNKPAIK